MNDNFPKDPIKKLIAIMAHLRSPQGCPWDRIQSTETLKPYLLEEAYEVVAALANGDPEEIKNELGDLLLQIVFMADIYRENGIFDFDSVAGSISDKLIRRHPHVFSDVEESDLTALDQQWESIKNSEKNQATYSLLDHQHTSTPALLQAQKISNKVARVGFDWENSQGVLDQLDDELAELKGAVTSGNKTAISNEIGDILFTVVNLGRHLDVDCESSLLTMIGRFKSRFKKMEKLIADDDKQMGQLKIDELNLYWQQAKQCEDINP